MTLKARKVRKRDEAPRPVPAAVCTCRQPPYPYATFVHGDLVGVELRHWARDGCSCPALVIAPAVYLGRV